MCFCHHLSYIESDAHAALRHIAVHEWLEQTLLLLFRDTRAAIRDDDAEHILSLISLHPYRHLASCRRIFHGIGEEVIYHGLHDVAVAGHLVLLLEYLIVHHDVFLLGCIPEILVDVAHEAHDIHACQHLKAQAVGIDFTELHQLGNEARQSLGTPHRRLHRSPRYGSRLLVHNLAHGTLDDGERRAELMGYMREEVDAEVVHLLLHLHALMQLELLLAVAHHIVAHHGYHQQISHPRIPHVVPWLRDMNLQRALIRPLVAPAHRTEMEHVVARQQGVVAHRILVGYGIPTFIHALQIILVNRRTRLGIVEVGEGNGDGILIMSELQTFHSARHLSETWHLEDGYAIHPHIGDGRLHCRLHTGDGSLIRIHHHHAIVGTEEQSAVRKLDG